MPSFIPPTQLIIGNHTQTIEHTYTFLQKMLCKKSSCGTCIHCFGIRQQEHHDILWISSEKNYTLADIAPIFDATALQLNPNQHFFIIIDHADALTPACANSLLKIMEEPPARYHFILLSEQLDDILPTIRSRAVITSLYGSEEHTPSHPLLPYFISNATSYAPRAFTQDLDKSKINERETINLIDTCLHYWLEKYKMAYVHNNKKEMVYTKRLVSLFQEAVVSPPMPGSAKLFWKNMFLKLHAIKDTHTK